MVNGIDYLLIAPGAAKRLLHCSCHGLSNLTSSSLSNFSAPLLQEGSSGHRRTVSGGYQHCFLCPVITYEPSIIKIAESIKK